MRAKIRDGDLIDLQLMLPRSRDDKAKKRFSIIDGLFEEVEDSSNMAFIHGLTYCLHEYTLGV